MKYRNEEDKCNGLAGMLIALMLLDEFENIIEIDIDDDNNEYIHFTPEFFAWQSQLVPPKQAWEIALRNFQLTTAMMMANLICRYSKSKKATYSDVRKAIFKTVAEEGKRACQLEEDEVNSIFMRTFDYVNDRMQNKRVLALAKSISSEISKRRFMGDDELKDLFASLQNQ